MLLAPFAHAQDADADEAAEPPEDAVVHIVEDRAGPARIPGTVTVLRVEDFESEAPISLSDVLQEAPGVHVLDEDGAGLRANLALRGLPPARSTKLLVLEDGLPVSPGPYGHPELYYSPAVERAAAVEVLRGSGSIRFGPQTIGGVVNVVGKEAPIGPMAEAEAQAGSHGWAYLRGAAGAGTEALAWRLDLFHKRYAGPRDIALVGTDVAGRLDARLGPGRLWVKAGAWLEESRPTYLGLTTPQFEADPSDNFAVHDHFDMQRYAFAGSYRAPAGEAAHNRTSVYAYTIGRAWGRQSYDRSDEGLDYERIVGTGADDGSTIFFEDANSIRDRRYDVAGVEDELVFVLAGGPVAASNRFGLRLHHEAEREHQYAGTSADAESGTLTEDQRRSGNAIAGWLLTDLWAGPVRVDGGLRVEGFWAERQLLWVETDAGGEDPGVDARAFHGALIPGLGVGVRATPGLFVFGGLHRGWTPPQTADAITDEGTVLELESESSWNAELGLHARHRGVVGVDLTAFYLLFENEVTAPTEAGAAASDPYVNGDPTRHVGLELAPFVDIGAWLGLPTSIRVDGAWTWVDARHTAGALEGNRLAYAPEHLLHLDASVKAPFGLRLGLGMDHVGAQFADAENTVEPSLDGLLGEIPAHTSFEADASFSLRDRGGRSLEIFVVGKNLADAPYILSRAPAGIQPGGFRSIQAGLRGRI